MPETYACDIVIAGAGPAGVAAALTAARGGARTLLIESSAQVGGTPLYGMHPFLCGLYRNDPRSPFDPLNRGLCMDVVARLDAMAGRDGRLRMGKVEVHAIHTGHYAQVLTELVDAEPRLTCEMNSRICNVRIRGARVDGVDVEGTLTQAVSTGHVIDCTGRGDLICLCRAERRESEDVRQLAAFCLRISDMDDPQGLTPVKVPYTMRQAAEKGILPLAMRYSVFSRDETGTGGVCKISLDPAIAAKGSMFLAELGKRVHDLLRSQLPEFGSSVLRARSPHVLQRSGVSLAGQFRLKREDVLQGRRFPDGCVRAAWPLELWDPARGLSLNYIEPGASYDIPRRCLQSVRLTNLSAAGRCISATQQALSSVRVSGTCFALGEAAANAILGSDRQGSNMEAPP